MALKIIFIFLVSFSSFAGHNHNGRQDVPDEIFHEDVDSNFIQRINDMLPERGQISESLLQNSEQAVFNIQQETDIFATFLWEGAGFKNSFGYFKLNQNNEKIEEVEVVGNASMQGSGGSLTPGDSFLMGRFNPGDRVGFYVWGNGWNRHNPNDRQKYYTYEPLNQDGIKHVVTAFDSIEEKVVIGFEDLWKGGDKDYNDLIFTVFSNPVNAINGDASERLLDTSGRQYLNDAYGNVFMSVAMYGQVTGLDDIILYPHDFNSSETTFSGIEEFKIESNCGVVLSVSLSDLSDGETNIPLDYLLDNLSHSLITQGASVHNQNHIIHINTPELSIPTIQAGDWLGNIILTLSVY